MTEFDAKAKTYDSGRYGPMYHAHNDLVLRHLNLSGGEHVIDIGCGGGYLLRRIAQSAPGVTGLGVDLSPGMIEAAENAARDLPNLRFVTSDWEDPSADLAASLSARPADIVVCASVLHYFADPGSAFERARKASVAGGRIFVFDRRKDRAPLNQIWDILHRHVIRDHVRFFREADIRQLLTQAGYRKPTVLERLDRYLWKKKFSTNVSLLRADA